MQRNIWVIALLLYIYKPFSLISLDSVTKKILLRDIRWVTYGIAQAFRDLTSSIFAPLSKRSGREWPARFCSGVAERRMLWTKLETEATKIGRKIVPSSGLIVRMRWSATVHEHAQKKSVRCNQYSLALQFHPEVSISWCYPWETRFNCTCVAAIWARPAILIILQWDPAGSILQWNFRQFLVLSVSLSLSDSRYDTVNSYFHIWPGRVLVRSLVEN